MEDRATPKQKILIVDDNPINLDVLFDYLDEAGLEVLVAEDGLSALDRAEHSEPDLILLDIIMPGIDGFETCERLKNNPDTKDIPIIFMTALSDTQSKMKGFKAGAVDYVTKPLSHGEVLARLQTHLTLKDLQNDLKLQNIQLQQEIVTRKGIEKALHQQAEALKSSYEELNAFSRTVAHDLESPLTTIIGFGSLLKNELILPEEHEKYLDIILNTAQRMDNIINDLLLLARIRETDILLKPLNMKHIIESVESYLAPTITKYKANITVSSTWPIALGYAPWIERVWVNYLSNALKYGGSPPHIKLGATPQSDGQIQFWIQDNGIGLTEDQQTQVFTEFTRLHKTEASGRGLGLSIVQRIIKKLGGHVGVKSKVGQGSTFYFTLLTPKDKK